MLWTNAGVVPLAGGCVISAAANLSCSRRQRGGPTLARADITRRKYQAMGYARQATIRVSIRTNIFPETGASCRHSPGSVDGVHASIWRRPHIFWTTSTLLRPHAEKLARVQLLISGLLSDSPLVSCCGHCQARHRALSGLGLGTDCTRSRVHREMFNGLEAIHPSVRPTRPAQYLFAEGCKGQRSRPF